MIDTWWSGFVPWVAGVAAIVVIVGVCAFLGWLWEILPEKVQGMLAIIILAFVIFMLVPYLLGSIYSGT